MTALATFSGSLVSARRAVGVQPISNDTRLAAQRQSLVLAQNLSMLTIQLSQAVPDIRNQFRSSQDIERFFQRLQVRNAHYDRGGPTVLGDNHTAMLTLDLVHDLRQAVLHVLQRHLRLDRHSYKCSYFLAGMPAWPTR
jgi:septum formation topological specificity factor MinE